MAPPPKTKPSSKATAKKRKKKTTNTSGKAASSSTDDKNKKLSKKFTSTNGEEKGDGNDEDNEDGDAAIASEEEEEEKKHESTLSTDKSFKELRVALKDVERKLCDAEKRVAGSKKSSEEMKKWQKKAEGFQKRLAEVQLQIGCLQSGADKFVTRILDHTFRFIDLQNATEPDPPLGELWLRAHTEWEEDPVLAVRIKHSYPAEYWPSNDPIASRRLLTMAHIAVLTKSQAWFKEIWDQPGVARDEKEGRFGDTVLHTACLSIARFALECRRKGVNEEQICIEEIVTDAMIQMEEAEAKKNAKSRFSVIEMASGNVGRSSSINLIANINEREQQEKNESKMQTFDENEDNEDNENSSNSESDMDSATSTNVVEEKTNINEKRIGPPVQSPIALCDLITCPDDCVAMVRSILAYPEAPIHATNNNQDTPLHIVAEAGHTPLVLELLALGADAKAIDAQQRTAFDVAVFHGNAITARAFLGHDISLARSEATASPIHFAIDGHVANACTLAQVIAVCREVVSIDPSILDAVDKLERTALHLAAHEQLVDPLCRLLYQFGADPDAIDSYGRTARDYVSHLDHGALLAVYDYWTTGPRSKRSAHPQAHRYIPTSL